MSFNRPDHMWYSAPFTESGGIAGRGTGELPCEIPLSDISRGAFSCRSGERKPLCCGPIFYSAAVSPSKLAITVTLQSPFIAVEEIIQCRRCRRHTASRIHPSCCQQRAGSSDIGWKRNMGHIGYPSAGRWRSRKLYLRKNQSLCG